MFYVALVLMSVLANGIAHVSPESCRDSGQLLKDLLERGISPTEVGQVHVSHSDAICFKESSQPSCCSGSMENAFKDQVQEFLLQKLVELMNDFEDSIQNHVDQFDHFVLYGIHGARREVLLRLRVAYGPLLSGTLDEVNTMFLNMAEYYTEGTITVEEIMDIFLESFYAQLTHQLFGRSTKRYLMCALTVMNETDPYFLTQNRNFLISAFVRPMLDFRAYSQSFRSIRKIFRRLKHMTVTDECKKNIVWSKICPFCHGLGHNLPPCPLLCTRVFENCTHFSDGVFFNSLIAYVDAMNPIAQRVGPWIDVVEIIPTVIGNAVQAFHFLWERTRHEVEESCGQSLYYSPTTEVPVKDTEGDIQHFNDPHTFTETLRRMYVLNNITQSILNDHFFCETSSPFSFPCWTGTQVNSSYADHDFPIFASDTPPEVLKEAKTLKRLAAKLRKVSTEGEDPFRPREGQDGGSLDLSKEIKLNVRMNNRTKAKPGEGVVLRCAIAGDPQVEYQWFKNDVLLTEERMGERMVIKTFNWGSKLIIVRAEPSDSGYYQCNGSNAYGKRSTSGLLVVRMRECPNQWHQFRSSCYWVTATTTFTSARRECTNTDNGDLVSIQSLEENEFITALVEREKAWIGARKDGDHGIPYWINGDEWIFSAISLIQSYYSPCVAINHIGPGTWSSAYCDTRMIAVCELSLS